MPVDVQPLISIGMPVYNGEKYIREAIDSLLAQRYVNLELIISDNASTDGTGSICKSYEEEDGRVSTYTQPINAGPVANFSFVLEQAQGEYFMWAACDDIWDEHWVERLVELLRESGECMAAYGRLLHIDEMSDVLPHRANDAVFTYTGPRLLRRMRYFLEWEQLGKANPFYALFRTDVLRGIDLSEFAYDFHFLFHILGKTGIASVPDVVIRKRVHADSLAASGATEAEAQRRVVRRLVSRLVTPVCWNSARRRYWTARRIVLPNLLVWWVRLLPGYFKECGALERIILGPLTVVKICHIYYLVWTRSPAVDW